MLMIMDALDSELLRHREIRFGRLHPEPHPAQSAAVMLRDLPGMEQVTVVDEQCIRVSYYLSHLSLQLIEGALEELGFHLDGSLLTKLKRALFYYTEENQRAALCDCAQGKGNCTDQVFVNRYERLKHGCRDDRPQHWREYL
jgi:hypothetical protein